MQLPLATVVNVPETLLILFKMHRLSQHLRSTDNHALGFTRLSSTRANVHRLPLLKDSFLAVKSLLFNVS